MVPLNFIIIITKKVAAYNETIETRVLNDIIEVIYFIVKDFIDFIFNWLMLWNMKVKIKKK